MFAFDPEKSAGNLAKHGIDFEAAQALWNDDFRLVVDTQYVAEERQQGIGKIGDKYWTAVITSRGGDVRIISVRRSRDNEVSAYDRQDD